MMVWYAVAAVFFLWLCGLSYFVAKTRKHYSQLTRRTGKHQIDEILEHLMEDSANLKKRTEGVESTLEKLGVEVKTHFQKIGFVRFNAFGRAGADQSFVLALLDEENSGIVMNFIYTHDGVRIYTKKVKKGEAEGHQLSDEEKLAIKESK